jgi:hypothetical protein
VDLTSTPLICLHLREVLSTAITLVFRPRSGSGFAKQNAFYMTSDLRPASRLQGTLHATPSVDLRTSL